MRDDPTLKRNRLWPILVVTWVGYCAYTMARRPYSVARSSIQAETAMSKWQSSMADNAFLVMYTVGQLSYGNIKQFFQAPCRILLASGLFGIALSIFFLGLSSGV